MFISLNKKGQGTAEYAILIGIVIAAVMAMQVYVKRGLQAGMKFAVDKSGKADSTGGLSATAQYEPYYLESKYNTKLTTQVSDSEEMQEGGGVNRVSGQATRTRTGYQSTRAIDEAD
jgi:hypothetical protein